MRLLRGGEFDLVLRKGVFRYEWFDDIRKLNETEFPPIEAFYSSLTEEGISAGDYEHGLKVWEKMGFKTMREYHDMYILSGGRAPTRRHHGVPAGPVDEHPRVGYSTLLHTSWLLLARRDKIHGTGTEAYFQSGDVRLIQKTKCGGISTVTHRYAKANNPYMGRIRGKAAKKIMKELRQRTKNERQFSVEMVCEYFLDFSVKEIKDLRREMSIGEVFKPQEVTTHLQYLDANSLYGWAMSQPLPVGGAPREWMTEEEFDLPIGEMSPCFIEVDLEYPIEPHDKFAEFVPAPENIIPEGSKVQKLAPNLLPKKGYVCHIKNLRLYVELGVKLVRVRKGVKFEEKLSLKSYIDMNTELRAAATNDADKDIYKLLNNAVFGRTCENLFKRTDYRLVSSRKQALDLIAKPTFKGYTVYNEKLAGIHLDPCFVTLNKPSYVDVAVLEISSSDVRILLQEGKTTYGDRATFFDDGHGHPLHSQRDRRLVRRHTQRRSDVV